MRSRSHLGSDDGPLSSSHGGDDSGDGGKDCDSWDFSREDDDLSVAPVVTESSLDIADDESMSG